MDGHIVKCVVRYSEVAGKKHVSMKADGKRHAWMVINVPIKISTLQENWHQLFAQLFFKMPGLGPIW